MYLSLSLYIYIHIYIYIYICHFLSAHFLISKGDLLRFWALGLRHIQSPAVRVDWLLAASPPIGRAQAAGEEGRHLGALQAGAVTHRSLILLILLILMGQYEFGTRWSGLGRSMSW